MKKIFKIIGIVFAVFLVIGFIGSSLEKKEGSQQEAAKETPAEIVGEAEPAASIEPVAEQQPEDKFTKEEALKKIQDYRITVDLKSPDIPKGTTILQAYEIKGKVPAIENLGWFAEEIETGKYIVSYKQTVSGDLPVEPRWEVAKDSIKALNGKAITITPEFGPKPTE